jgi:hypothetical protein
MYGFNINGFNKDGLDSKGYDINELNKDGKKKEHLHSIKTPSTIKELYKIRGKKYIYPQLSNTKFNRYGFDENGIHMNGTVYDNNGFEYDGMHISGNKYDEDGFDIDGLDKFGYDIDGYDENGFNKKGFHRNGTMYGDDDFDKEGYECRYGECRCMRDGGYKY